MTNTNDLTPKTVCAECLKKTKIGYDDGGRFFMPHFKSINHVEVGYSKIITNPLTIFTEWQAVKRNMVHQAFSTGMKLPT